MTTKEKEPILTVDAKALKDFQLCNRYFYYHQVEDRKKFDKIGTLQDRFEDTMRQIIAYFFFKKQGGAIPSYQSLVKRWEKLWFPRNTTAADILNSTQYNKKADIYTMAALAGTYLLRFYEEFSESLDFPIVINEDYHLPFSAKILLKGKFDTILRNPQTEEIKIIHWNTKKNHKNSNLVDHVFAKLAYEYSHPETRRLTSHWLFDFTVSQPFRELNITEADVNSIKYWMQELSDDNIYPSRRGLISHCNVCAYNSPCAAWTANWPEMKVSIGHRD